MSAPIPVDFGCSSAGGIQLCDLGTARRLDEQVDPSRVAVDDNESGGDAGVRRYLAVSHLGKKFSEICAFFFPVDL